MKRKRKKNHFPSASRRLRRLLAIGERHLEGRLTIEEQKEADEERRRARQALERHLEGMKHASLRPDILHLSQQEYDDIVKWANDEAQA